MINWVTNTERNDVTITKNKKLLKRLTSNAKSDPEEIKGLIGADDNINNIFTKALGHFKKVGIDGTGLSFRKSKSLGDF